MINKKKYIMNTAIELFAGNGYHNTTMAAIAGSCNISKATLYKFFPSKEELVLEAGLYLHNKMQEEVEAVDDDSLSPHDMMAKKLEAMMRVTMRCMDFRSVIKHALPRDMPQKYRRSMLQNHTKLTEKVKLMIVAAYGEDAEPISWDLTLCLVGTMHELMAMHHMGGNVQCEQAAMFIMDCLDGIVQHRKGKQPFFDKSYVNQHIVSGCDIVESLDDIKNQADCLSKPNKDKVLAAASVIEKYLYKGKADRIIIEGMLSMLGEYPELSDRVDRLRQSLDCIEP